MAKIIKQRMAAQIEGDFVVFMIGARINKPWKLHRWLWIAFAMPRMLRELSKQPEAGLIGYRTMFGLPPMTIQYWRSFEQLEAYSRSKDSAHFPAWVKFNKSIASNGDVGIWHETYKVAAGQCEAIYNNMPAYGLGKIAGLVPAAGYRRSAQGRITGEDVAPPVDETGNVPAGVA